LRSRPAVVRAYAEREAAWFFREVGGAVPDGGDPLVRGAAAQIDGWFGKIPTFHRGVLDLRFTRRSWPGCIRREFGVVATIAVRVEGAQHPAAGSTEQLELASVERLREIIRLARVARARRGGRVTEVLSEPEMTVERLFLRSARYVNAALRALTDARGNGPFVLPPREWH
jgi:hypothetical protein